MTPLQPSRSRRTWISITLAGLLLGFTFALGFSGLVAVALQGLKMSVRTQVVMWVVVPVWLPILSGCFAFRSGKQAWMWLGAANASVFCILGALRLF